MTQAQFQVAFEKIKAMRKESFDAYMAHEVKAEVDSIREAARLSGIHQGLAEAFTILLNAETDSILEQYQEVSA